MKPLALTNIAVRGEMRAALQLKQGYLDLASAMQAAPSPAWPKPVDEADVPRSALEAAINTDSRQWLARFGQEFRSATFDREELLREYILPPDEIRVLPPVIRPGKVICVGLNYPGVEPASSSPAYPVLFHKVSTSIIAGGETVRIPIESSGLSYEGELTVVIGKPGRRIPLAESNDHIAGFTIANDIGAPDIQARSSQWTSGKMIDTFCPLGPSLILADEIPTPGALIIETRLNDELVQRGPVADMLFDIPHLITYISSLVTLEPGDLVLTGSPKKIDERADPQILMKAGDVVSVSVQPLGTLTNTIDVEE